MSTLFSNFEQKFGKVNEKDLSIVFTKSGILTRKTVGLTNKHLALVNLLKKLNIKTKNDYKILQFKIELDEYEKIHGKINPATMTNLYNKDGKLTKKVTNKNNKLIELLNRTECDHKIVLNKKLNEVAKFETKDTIKKEPKEFKKKQVVKPVTKPVKKAVKHTKKELRSKFVVKPVKYIPEEIENESESDDIFGNLFEEPIYIPIDEDLKRETEEHSKQLEDEFNEVLKPFTKIVSKNRIDEILKQLNEVKNLNGYYFKYHIKGGDPKKWTAIPINSDNIKRIEKFLRKESYLFMNENELDNTLAGYGIDSRNDAEKSDSNLMNLDNQKLTPDQLDKIVITNKSFGTKDSEIDFKEDNGGAFYNGRLIDSAAHLEKFTQRYQIFNTYLETITDTGVPVLVTDKEEAAKYITQVRFEFNYNCLTYAFLQSGLIDKKTLEAIMARCYTRLVSRKQVVKICEQFKIAVQIKKYRKDKKQWDNIDPKHTWLGYVTNDSKGVSIPKSDAIAKICLGLHNKHYFLDEYVEGLSSFYLKHMDEIDKAISDDSKYTVINTSYQRSKEARIRSRQLIILLEELNLVKPLTFDERAMFQSDLYQYVTNNITEINLHENDFKLIKPRSEEQKDIKKSKEKKLPVFYADCESDVSGEQHVAFCIASMSREKNDAKIWFGPNCLDNWLESLPNKCIVYFHNLGYDARLMSKYKFRNQIMKDGKIITTTIIYFSTDPVTKKKVSKSIKLKDSYSILTMKLSNFVKAFNLKCGQKEMFPYKYYTQERLYGNTDKIDQMIFSGESKLPDVVIPNIGKISEAGIEEIQWNNKDLARILATRCIEKSLEELKWDQKQFEENIKLIKGCDLGNGQFDMMKYASFYVSQDVRILKEGFDKFREILMNPEFGINIDPDEYLSMPAIAYEYFTREVFSKVNGGMYEYAGITRAYIQKIIYGGRCMTRDNEKWHVTKTLNDFDAVSLYPSAMNRLYCVSGTPIVLKPEQLNVDYLLSHTALENDQTSIERPIASYIVHINITKVGKHRHFPLIVKKVKEKGALLNKNVNECCEMYVDNILLEDLIKYQEIECEVLDGIAWFTTKDFYIREVVQNVFNLRAYLKSIKSAAQEAIKLLLNSSYGKTIQKPITTDVVYKPVQVWKIYKHEFNKKGVETKKSMQRFIKYAERIKIDKDGNEYIKLQKTPADSFCLKNHAKIKEAYDIAPNLVCIKVNKQIDDFYIPNLIGGQILSMSKRIMNEVMCTAEDLNIDIFYQDTDSMHIDNDKIGLLADEFKKKFGRELIGSKLGQFHSDFEPIIENGSNPVSIESYFLGKKAYIDKLQDENNNIGYHIRMKGVTDTCIQLKAIDNFDYDVMKLYKYLSDGNSLQFNLTDAKAKFKNNKNLTVSSINNFKRTIKFNGPTFEK